MLRVNIVGIGPGNPELLTNQARRAIEESNILIGDKRMLVAFGAGKHLFDTIKPVSYTHLSGIEDASTAMISLDGKKSQTFILPLYVDYFRAVEGEYNLRVTVFGNGQEKIQEVPITIAKKRSMGLFAVGFSFLCFLIVCLNADVYKRQGSNSAENGNA